MRILIAFALALTFAVPEVAAERIRVRDFSGSKRMARKVQSYVAKVVKNDFELVSKNYDGVIKGKVQKRGSGYKVLIVLYDRNGEAVKKAGLKIGRRGPSSKERKLIRKWLGAQIKRLPAEGGGDEFADDEFADDEFSDDDEFADDEVADSGDSDESDAEVSKSASVGAAFRGEKGYLYAGLSVVRRKFGFGNDIGNYNGAPAGSISLDASLYPLLYTKNAKGWKRNIGIGLAYERSVGLKSRFEGGTDNSELPTTQSRFIIDARYRIRFGKKARALTVLGTFGVERLSFNIDRSNAPTGVTIMVPDTKYTSVIPGAEVWYPINEKLAVLASANMKVVVGAGQIVDSSQYGTGKGYGFGLAGGAEYLITDTISVRGGLQYDQIKIDFQGDGDLSMMGNFEQSSDTYLGGFVTTGFKL